MLLIPLAVQTIADDSDRTLIESLYRQHYRLMRTTASRYCQDKMDIDDILSDSLVALIPKVEQLRSMESRAQSAYILTTVRNTAISYLRRRKLTSAPVPARRRGNADAGSRPDHRGATNHPGGRAEPRSSSHRYPSNQRTSRSAHEVRHEYAQRGNRGSAWAVRGKHSEIPEPWTKAHQGSHIRKGGRSA